MGVMNPRALLMLAVCLGAAACGGVAVGNQTAADVPPADAVSADARLVDIPSNDLGRADAPGADAPSVEAGVADAVGVEVGRSDGALVDTSAVEVGAANGGDAGTGDVVDAGASDAAVDADLRADVAPEAGMDAAGPAEAAVCSGAHPLVDAGARFCGPGQCYCPAPGTGGDSCLPAGTAAACCPGRSVVCTASDAGAACPAGTHPLLDGGARFCAVGSCYCPSPGINGDACLPAGAGAACCPGRSVVCASEDAGVTCPAATHPLVDGGARFCAPGSCYCPSSDACRPVAVARMCCPTAVICD